MTSLKLALALLGLAGVIGIAIGYYLRVLISMGKRGSMELEIRQKMLETEERAKKIIEEAEIRGRERAETIAREQNERTRELKTTEERLVRKEELLDKRQTNLDSEQETIAKKNEDLQSAREEAQKVIAAQQEKLEKVAGLTADEAKHELIRAVEKQNEADIEGRMRKLEISGNEKLEQRAREILTTSVHRLGNSVVSDVLATTVSLPNDEIKGKIIEEVLPLGNLKEGKINLRSLDGEISHINVRNFPLKDENNQVKGEIYVLRDVTKADQLEEMKLDFVSSVAHQLRTPITTIRSYLAVLSESVVKKLETEDRELLNRAMIVVNQLATLVENLLNVMKIEKGRLNVEAKPLSLEPIIEETIAALAVIAQQQEVKLTFENPPADFPKVKGDSYLIKEVLTNLIINGINFNHRGGWVIISLQKESQSVIVHIRDNGKGIPPQSIPYLFNRFYKVSNEYIMESKGVGLGLYISQAIVQALGGKIWVNSIEGKGTTFSFSLSLAV